MVTILCIDDTPEIQTLVSRTFANTAKVLSAETLHEGYEKLSQNNVDLILLDLTLPDGDGFQFFNKLQENPKHISIPVIVLTAKDQIQNKIMGFHLGAEDYIVKPFDPAELKIRVESRIKHRQNARNQESIFTIGNMTINYLEQRVTISTNGKTEDVNLTTTEFKILSYLCKHKEQVLSRDQIINSAWKYGYNISDRTIDSHISRIRKKISKSENTILAIHNVGYKFALNKEILTSSQVNL